VSEIHTDEVDRTILDHKVQSSHLLFW